MGERELVLTSLIYPLIFREAAQIGIATPIAAHIRELLKIHTPEPEVIRVGNATPVSASVRNIFQNYEHPLQDYAQIGVAKPVGAYFKNLFNEYIHPHSDFTQIGNAIPVSLHQVNLLKNLQTFKTDHVVQVGNAIPEAVYSTCKPVVFAPINLRGWYNDESIRLFWSNSSITHTHQNLYRSTTPFTESNLPPVYQYIFRGVNSYIDEDVVEGITYYYAVSTEAGLVQLVSDVTEVVTVEVPDACDPHWDKVVALLHFDGNLTDETGRVWGTIGSPTFEYISPIYGTGSFKTDGRDAAQTANLNLINDNNEPYCIEFTFKAISLNNYGMHNPLFWCYSIGPWGDSVIGINSSTGLFVQLHSGANSWIIENNLATILLDTKYHLALTYDGSDLRVFLDGVLVHVGVGVKIQTPTGPLRFGTVAEGSYMQGSNHIYDELRITKGVARYTENFTPPTEPFPNFGCS